nr:unnamed protein product [Trichobilharzia regenti]
MSVKSKIQRAEGIPIIQQHLIWQNDELDDHRRLRDYSITQGSTLRLVLGLRGGPLNAHRIPPLRLAPIHLSQTALPRFPSRFGYTCSNGFMHPSILTPPMKPNSLQSQNTNSRGVCNPFLRKSERISQKADTERFKLSETKGDNLPIIDCAPKLEPIEVSANARLRNSATSSDSTLKTKESGIDPSTDFQISSVNTNTSIDPESNEHNSNSGNNTLQASEEAVSMAITSQDTIDAFSSIEATCSVTGCERSTPEVLTRTPDNSTLPIVCHNSEAKPYSFSPTHKEEFSDSPPLLSLVRSSEKYYPVFEAAELPSLCQLFETHDNSVLTSGKHSTAEISEGINTAKESDNENATDLIEVREFDLLDDGDSEKSKSTTATFLANLLAKVIPSQRRCTDYRGRLRYPCQGLSKAPPLLEEDEEQNSFANSGFFDGHWPDEDPDAFAANVFEADTDRDEDDGDDDDSKRSYSSVLEQDDNLAELEDHLLHHQQVEELYGSPLISSGYPPCSNYTFRGPLGVKQCDSRGNLDSVESGTTGLYGANHAAIFSWYRECSQLAEKVNNLKTEMKNVRIRRQGLHQNDKEIVCVTCEEGSPNEDQSSDAFEQGESSKEDDKNFFMDEDSPPLPPLVQRIVSDAWKACIESQTTRSPPEGIGNRIRQRRYATVTPPDVNFLIKTNNSQDKCSVTNDSTVPCVPDSEGIPRNLENNNPHSSPRLTGGYWSPSKNHASAYLNKELKQCCGSVKQSLLPSVDSLQCNKTLKPVTSHSLSPIVNCLSVLKVTADELKPHSSPPTFLPNLGNPASMGRLTTVNSSLFSKGENPAASNGYVNCDPKLSDSLSSHTVPSSKTEGFRPPSPNSTRCKRCALCLRKIGLANNYTCRCGRSFCSRHRYAEVHACPYDYKAEARRFLIESNPAITAPKFPKI